MFCSNFVAAGLSFFLGKFEMPYITSPFNVTITVVFFFLKGVSVQEKIKKEEAMGAFINETAPVEIEWDKVWNSPGYSSLFSKFPFV